MTVQIRYLTDPACPWSWGVEPQLRRLAWEFGEGLRFHWVMGGLARSYDPARFADLAEHWLDVAAESGMPLDPLLWARGGISSTHPACMAVKAAAEQGDAAVATYLRRAREGLMAKRRKLDHVEALVAEATAVGIDAQRFRIDLSSHAILEAFGADLEEVRSVPDEARDTEGAVTTSDGHERLTFPTVFFSGPDGARHAVYGVVRYASYREAAVAAGAAPVESSRPGVLDAIERFGRCATREVEELTGLPAPVCRAELWGLAREWKLRAEPVLTGGELWELA